MRGPVFGDLAQCDQRAEDLVRRLQTDQAVPAAHAGGAARAQHIEHNAAGRLDRLAHGTAMLAGMRSQAPASVAGRQHRAHVGGEGGQRR